jgi:hypothetical protein
LKLVDFVNKNKIDIDIEKVTINAFELYQRFLKLIFDKPIYLKFNNKTVEIGWFGGLRIIDDYNDFKVTYREVQHDNIFNNAILYYSGCDEYSEYDTLYDIFEISLESYVKIDNWLKEFENFNNNEVGEFEIR